MIEAIDDRLWEWADWHRRGIGGGSTVLGRMIDEGLAGLIRGSGARVDPGMPWVVDETDKAVQKLDHADQRFLRIHYFQPTDPLLMKARMVRLTPAQYEHRLEQVHYRVQAELQRRS